MNSFLFGIVLGVAGAFIFLGVLVVVYELGKRSVSPRGVLKTTSDIKDIEKEKELARMNEGINNIMNYDYNVAMGLGGDTDE